MEKAALRNRHRDKFLIDNPELKTVVDSPHSEVLLWADEEDYINLTKFEDELFYSSFDLETALIWKEKTQDEQ